MVCDSTLRNIKTERRGTRHGRHRCARRTGRDHPADARRGRGTGRARLRVIGGALPVETDGGDHRKRDGVTACALVARLPVEIGSAQADGATGGALPVETAHREERATDGTGAHGAQAATIRRTDGADAAQAAQGARSDEPRTVARDRRRVAR